VDPRSARILYGHADEIDSGLGYRDYTRPGGMWTTPGEFHPAGNACGASQSAGHSNLLAVITPNLICKPATVMITKVTIKGAKQAVQMFGPAQAAVAKAVTDCVAAGVIPKGQVEDLVIVCGVFIHWEAKDDKKIYDYNYQATKEAITRAMKHQPSMDEVLSKKDTAKHPFA
jgi:5,6,7,8-tetrahydromethanopterin hydro-lyase